MARGLGHASFIGFGLETTYGTAVSRTLFLRFLEENLSLKQAYVNKPTLGYTSQVQGRRTKGKASVDGSFRFQFGFNGAETLLKNALGAVATTNPGTLAYQHTFTPADSLPVGLTFEVSRDAANIGTAYAYDGCKIERLTLRQEMEDILACEVAIQGQDETKVSASSPSYPTFAGVEHHMLTTCTIDGNTVKARNVEVNIENAFDTDNYNLGSRSRTQLHRNGTRRVSGKMEIEFDGATQYDHFRDMDEVATVIGWNGGTDSIESGQDYTLTITMSRTTYGVADIGTPDAGPLWLPVEFDAWATSAGNNEISLVLKNTTTSVT